MILLSSIITMPMCKDILRKSVSSLVSLSTECVAANIDIHAVSLNYLPPHIQKKLLCKFLRGNRSCRLPLNQLVSLLIHDKLKTIDLSSIPANDETLNIVQRCHQLTEINLRNNGTHNFSTEGLKRLFQQTKNLLALDISLCQQFNDEVMECLSINCKSLSELSCEGCEVSDGGLNFLIKNNKVMKRLKASNTKITGDGISDAVKNVNWRHLQELRLDNCENITDEVLKMVIQNCPKIEILTFYNCAITDETSLFEDITDTCLKLKQLHWTVSW